MKKILLGISIILALTFICSESSRALYADERTPIFHAIQLDA